MLPLLPLHSAALPLSLSFTPLDTLRLSQHTANIPRCHVTSGRHTHTHTCWGGSSRWQLCSEVALAGQKGWQSAGVRRQPSGGPSVSVGFSRGTVARSRLRHPVQPSPQPWRPPARRGTPFCLHLFERAGRQAVTGQPTSAGAEHACRDRCTEHRQPSSPHSPQRPRTRELRVLRLAVPPDDSTDAQLQSKAVGERERAWRAERGGPRLSPTAWLRLKRS